MKFAIQWLQALVFWLARLLGSSVTQEVIKTSLGLSAHAIIGFVFVSLPVPVSVGLPDPKANIPF